MLPLAVSFIEIVSFQWEQLQSLCKSILLIGLCHNLRISCNGWFYFPFDMICKSKRAINFHPLISIKANGITSHYNGNPWSVTSSYKFAAPKKDEKGLAFSSFFGAANLYDEVTVRGCPYSEKWCYLLLLKWVDENWSLFFIYKSCPVTYKINYYSLFLSRGTIASRLIKWIYKEIGIALAEKKKQQG